MFHGENVAALPANRRNAKLLTALQMIFQDPHGTLNPSHSIGWSLRRAVKKLRPGVRRAEIAGAVDELLDTVHLPRALAARKPRQLSDGQKQRIAIARALAGDPDLVLADEPVSALDVSVQAAIISLLIELQREKGISLVFISNDLAVVRYLSDHVVVMYLGQVMESGTVD